MSKKKTVRQLKLSPLKLGVLWDGVSYTDGHHATDDLDPATAAQMKKRVAAGEFGRTLMLRLPDGLTLAMARKGYVNTDTEHWYRKIRPVTIFAKQEFRIYQLAERVSEAQDIWKSAGGNLCDDTRGLFGPSPRVAAYAYLRESAMRSARMEDRKRLSVSDMAEVEYQAAQMILKCLNLLSKRRNR